MIFKRVKDKIIKEKEEEIDGSEYYEWSKHIYGYGTWPNIYTISTCLVLNFLVDSCTYQSSL